MARGRLQDVSEALENRGIFTQKVAGSHVSILALLV